MGKPNPSGRATGAGQHLGLDTLEQRSLFSTVNVDDFGAHPDDGIDDRAAVQWAINSSAPGDTILFSGGVFDLSGDLMVQGQRTYKGDDGATLKGRGAEGQLMTLRGDATAFVGLTFEGGGIFIDNPWGAFNRDITIDSNIFRINTRGEHTSGITFTSGLADSTITNNYFTGYRAKPFAIYGYNYNGLTIANNELVNIWAGMHVDAFYNSGNLLVDQNFISGVRGMGMEFQGTATNLVFQDNWYQNPNLAANFNDNRNSMAFSLILDKSSHIMVRRNTVLAPQRLDGKGTRIAFEVGGNNAAVEDNYVNGVNHVLAMNDGVGSASVIARNNKFMNYLEGPSARFPSSNRRLVDQNNGPWTQLSWSLDRQRPGRGDRRYTTKRAPSAKTAAKPVVAPPPAVPVSSTVEPETQSETIGSIVLKTMMRL